MARCSPACFTDAFGSRAAVLLLVVPSTIIGGLLIMRSSTFIRNDLSLVVAELQEELDEHRRQQATPSDIPALQVSRRRLLLRAGAGAVRRRLRGAQGEVLALLGTNGAGKSTILRVIAGLGTPSRGVVRLHGRTITYVAPEQRAQARHPHAAGRQGRVPAT